MPATQEQITFAKTHGILVKFGLNNSAQYAIGIYHAGECVSLTEFPDLQKACGAFREIVRLLKPSKPVLCVDPDIVYKSPSGKYKFKDRCH